jgi:hypothetical protein
MNLPREAEWKALVDDLRVEGTPTCDCLILLRYRAASALEAMGAELEALRKDAGPLQPSEKAQTWREWGLKYAIPALKWYEDDGDGVTSVAHKALAALPTDPPAKGVR